MKEILSGDDKVIKYLKESGMPLYIYGNGELAEAVTSYLNDRGIKIKAYFVDDEYFQEADRDSNRVYPISELNVMKGEHDLILGQTACLKYTWQDVEKKFPQCVMAVHLSEVYPEYFGIDYMDEEYYKEHKQEFDTIINSLFDEVSKKSMTAYLKAKVEKDRTYLFPYIVSPQYFFDEMRQFIGNNEIVVDCGAFEGDSLQDFLKLTGGTYEKYYACEPNIINLTCCREYAERNCLKNIEFVQKGIWNQKGYLQFGVDSEGVSPQVTRINGHGETVIETDSIDNILNGDKATIIKMDIEGAEKKAIEGAKNTIAKYHPLLCISAYHCKDDIIKLYRMINEYYSGYKFMFRLHKFHALDAVLYAVPNR